jgi:hypothetical protein
MNKVYRKIRILTAVAIFLTAAFVLFTLPTRHPIDLPQNDRDPNTKLPREERGKFPMSFIQNEGQLDQDVAYYVQAPGTNFYFTPKGHILQLNSGKGKEIRSHSIKIEMIDAATERVESQQLASGLVSYFKGGKNEWRTGVPIHNKIGYVAPWPGIDLSYDGSGGKLESIYTIAAFADPTRIKLRYSGQDSLKVDDNGNLVYGTSLGEVTETAPVAWQEINGNQLFVKTSFRVLNTDTVTFEIGAYDTSHELLIDPTLLYASYIGGSGDDRGHDVALDSSGNIYITGYTASTNLPVTVGPDTTQNGDYDAYVAKLNPAGTTLLYMGYIGGTGYDGAYSIAVDSSGNAYVAGDTTSSSGFPVTVGPDTSFNGGTYDGFVAKVNSSGTALTYAGFIGGSESDSALSIAVDNTGNAYVAGTTSSTQSSTIPFPVTVGPDLTYNGGGSDAFVAKVNSSGSALSYAGYIGGTATDEGYGIALDGSGKAYVCGRTDSTESAGFPVTVGPDLTFNLPNTDAFVARLNTSGTSLEYCGYIGGDNTDNALAIAVDNAGSAYVTGRTSSSGTSFPVKVGPDLTQANGFTFDAYVVKVNPAGTGIVYGGFIGGFNTEYGFGITVDNVGSAYISGYTESSESTFPVTVGPDVTYNGNVDAFVAKVRPSGKSFVYAGYIGGSSGDIARGITVDASGNAYVMGNTDSTQTSFPDGDGFGSVPGFDQTFNGGGDAWLAKISAMAAPTLFDFDGDGKTDLSLFRPSTGYWYLSRSTAGSFALPFGVSTDTIVPGDYDGDGKTDIAVFRSGTWYRYFMGSGSNDSVINGTTGDIPAVGDFDADGIADTVVFRGSTSIDWYIKRSSDGSTMTVDYGSSGDQPVVGDYDGDGTADVAVFRPSNSTWYIQRSTAGAFSLQWGATNDKIVPADYDGDGKTDIAVFRPSTGFWYRYFIGTGTNDYVNYGLSADLPVPGDYDGDGKFDIAVFRPSSGTWYLHQSTAGDVAMAYGVSGDKPAPNAFVR